MMIVILSEGKDLNYRLIASQTAKTHLRLLHYRPGPG